MLAKAIGKWKLGTGMPLNRQQYGFTWAGNLSQAKIEIKMCRMGGQIVYPSGRIKGNGLAWHFRRLQEILFGNEKIWHEWNELQLDSYLSHRTCCVIGPASSGKTNSAATDALTDYYIWPNETTVIVCSTTKERLEDRVFGEIKKYHRIAKKNHAWLPGNLIEGRLRIVTDSRSDSVDGRDFRNGIIGVPCFCPETEVVTANGKIKIKDVKVGDMVANAVGFGIVTETHARISKEIVRVHLSDGRTIDCTPEHPFLTQRGWINAVDMTNLDMVFSHHETLQFVQSAIASRIPKQEVLQLGVPGLPPREAMPSMQDKFQAVEQKLELEEQQIHGELLLEGMCRKMGGTESEVQDGSHQDLQTLREDNGTGSQPKGFLLVKMPEPDHNNSLLDLRECIRVNQGIASEDKVSFLLNVLQAEGDWSKKSSQDSQADQGGDSCLERVQGIDDPISPEDGIKNQERKVALVLCGHSVSRNKAGGGSGWRNSQNAGKDCERLSKNKDIEVTWVDRIEILKPDGDYRYDASKGGYPVFNLEVSGHPSYTANGIVVHNCKRGGDYVGLGDFIGIKNKRVRLVADELQLLPSAFVMAISNLDKNPDLKVLGLGNPKETTDALGVFGEPAYDLGGWDGGIDQTPKTKTWRTRRPDGICVQLVGSDSPNLDGKLGCPLITQSAIDRDIAQYGKDSLQFTMMNQGMMPRGQGSRRVITRQLCMRNRALEDPEWLDGNRTKIAFLDASYRGAGGDRCIFGYLEFGAEAGTVDASNASFVPNLISQSLTSAGKGVILHLCDTELVPVNVKIDVEAEEQIVSFVKTRCTGLGIPPENFFYDSGMRTSLVTAFSRIWSPLTNPIDCGGSPTDRPVTTNLFVTDKASGRKRLKRCDEHYCKFITELWFSVRYVIEAGQFRGMQEGVMKEGCQREWTMVGSNKIEIETKEKMKEKTGRSPDLFDALAIGIEGARQRGFLISNLVKVEQREADNSWRVKMREDARKLWQQGSLNHSA